MTWPLSSRSTTAQACRLPSDRRMESKFYQRQHVSDGTNFFDFLFRLAQAGSAEDTRRDEAKHTGADGAFLSVSVSAFFVAF